MADEKTTPKKSETPTYTVYDPEVEKERIKYQRELTDKIMNFLNNNIPTFMEYWKEGQKIEYHGLVTIPKMALFLVGTMFLVLAVLTYADKVSGESLIFLMGIIVGYLLSMIKPQKGEE